MGEEPQEGKETPEMWWEGILEQTVGHPPILQSHTSSVRLVGFAGRQINTITAVARRPKDVLHPLLYPQKTCQPPSVAPKAPVKNLK